MFKNAIMSVFSIASFTLAQGEDLIVPRFREASIEFVLEEYSRFSGDRVDLVQGIHIPVTIISDEKLTVDEYLQLVEKKLNELNIGLFRIDANRLVAAWIDPPLAPKRQHGVIRPLQKTEDSEVQPQVRRFYSREELEAHLREQQMDAIRTGKEPLPIPLTPEMESQLIEEGVLEVGELEIKPEKTNPEKE